MANLVRVHRSLLADWERKTLVWLARRLPGYVHSDHLTLLGLGALGLTAGAFAMLPHTPWAAAVVVIGLALNWLGDSLDGTLARVRSRERPRYGFYVDHVVDCAGATLLLAGMASSGVMSPIVAAAVLVGFLLVAAESYLAAHSLGVFRLSSLGVGPTELRILLAVGTLMVANGAWVDVPLVGAARLFDVGGVIAATGLAMAFMGSAFRNIRALALTESIDPGREEIRPRVTGYRPRRSQTHEPHRTGT
jgi:phosphatidylglycerophosphate synthase